MIAAAFLAAIALVAGKPVTVTCDPTLNGHASQAVGFAPAAWTAYGGNVIYAMPSVCNDTSAPVGSDRFAGALGVFLHEASHARGIRQEACAELTADLGVYQALRDEWHIKFFTATSWRIGAQVLAFTRKRPADYQPERCVVYG